jgi:hypothetical protein
MTLMARRSERTVGLPAVTTRDVELVEQAHEPTKQVFADPSGRRALRMCIVELLLLVVTVAVIGALVAGTADLGRSPRSLTIDAASAASVIDEMPVGR